MLSDSEIRDYDIAILRLRIEEQKQKLDEAMTGKHGGLADATLSLLELFQEKLHRVEEEAAEELKCVEELKQKCGDPNG